MIRALGILLACQLAGEVTVGLTGLPVPGPVVGLALLLAVLLVRGRAGSELSSTAHGLLRHLSLLFVPAGVGFIAHVDRLGGDLPALAAGIVISTLLTLAVTAGVFLLVSRLTGGRS
jgi:putative effector of murein hydrolase LrgA (UPF0299 family)